MTEPLFHTKVKPLPAVGVELPADATPPIRISWALLVEIPETVGVDEAPWAIPLLAPFGSNGVVVFAPEMPMAVMPL